jgi:2-keto-4-pentenoate hydratase
MGRGMMIVGLQELARKILADNDARTPGRLSAEPLDLTTAQAYAVQAEITRLREQRGENILGYKVGCTSRAIQAQLGVDEPIFGRLFDTESHPPGAHLSAARYANLAVEGEIAVRLSNNLPCEPLSADEYRQAIAEVFPVIELHHYVLPSTWPPGRWLIASGGMHAGFVFAEPETRPKSSEHSARSLSVRINDVVVGNDDDAAALRDRTIESLRWLAGRLARFGLRLCKGQVILTGSPMNLFPVIPGSRIVVDAPPLGVSFVQIDR